MSITLADKASILKRLYDDNPDIWIFAQADAIELIEKQGDALDALQTPMPCGHLARYATTNKNNTQYCVCCELETTQRTLIRLEQLEEVRNNAHK